jgi:phage host-nuclease inhibitor protein Gam
MKSRIKLPLQQPITSRDEAEMFVGDIALLTLGRIRATAKMDAEIATVRGKYESYLAANAESLKSKTESLRAWSEENPEAFPKGRKSIQFVQGTIGFRTGTPKLSLLSRLWNWDKVHKAVIALGLSGYIRTKEELDKENIIATAIANHDQAAAATHCAAFGTKVVQEESFFVDPNITEVEKRQALDAV